MSSRHLRRARKTTITLLLKLQLLLKVQLLPIMDSPYYNNCNCLQRNQGVDQGSTYAQEPFDPHG